MPLIALQVRVKLHSFAGWQENKLTLTNLAKKGCNVQNATNTCVLCHKNSETVDCLLLHYEFSGRIWSFFKHILNFQSLPYSLTKVWTTWIPSLKACQRAIRDILSRAIFWNIWLESNHLIFNYNVLHPVSVMFQIIHLLLASISAAGDQPPSDFIQNIKRFLGFLSARSADFAICSL